MYASLNVHFKDKQKGSDHFFVAIQSVCDYISKNEGKYDYNVKTNIRHVLTSQLGKTNVLAFHFTIVSSVRLLFDYLCENVKYDISSYDEVSYISIQPVCRVGGDVDWD